MEPNGPFERESIRDVRKIPSVVYSCPNQWKNRTVDATHTTNQGLDRTLALLRAVAAGGRAGARLTGIAAATGLSKSTAHRLLAALLRAGLLEQEPDSLAYHLGFEIYALGRMAADRYGLLNVAQASLLRLAQRTEDTVYLQVRSGDDAVCLAREEGRFPIKTLTLAVNDRRPLGIGGGSLALLSTLTDAEVEQVLEANADRLRDYPTCTPAVLRDMVALTRRQGFSFNPGIIIPGMSAIGLPIFDSDKRAVGSISIAAIESRMQHQRQRELLALLREEVVAIEDKIRDLRGDATHAARDGHAS